jgi:pterin-4a-carbinolamine dehydratase
MDNIERVATQRKLIFISYRRKDSSLPAQLLSDSLQLAFGNESVFMDRDSIRGADNWKARIDRALESASLLIVVIGPQWLRMYDEDGRRRLDIPGDWVRDEITHGLASKIPIMPVLVQKSDLPRRAALPEAIQQLVDYQGFILSEDRWDRDLELLVQEVETRGFVRIRDDVVYPTPLARPISLLPVELEESLKRLPDWRVARRRNEKAKDGETVELMRNYSFVSFEDAIHFMVTASRHISRVNHHPDWRNLWINLTVWLTTRDIGHRPSTYDVALAEYLDQLYVSYEPPK